MNCGQQITFRDSFSNIFRQSWPMISHFVTWCKQEINLDANKRFSKVQGKITTIKKKHNFVFNLQQGFNTIITLNLVILRWFNDDELLF